MPTRDQPQLDDAFARLTSAASHACTSQHNHRPGPTPAQAVARNYLMGRTRLHGLAITIENDRNSVRSGTSADGKQWSNRMGAIYGELAGTRGADGDAVDVFIGHFPESRAAWIINQGWPDGGFDEHKVMLGFATEQQARDAYLMSFDRDWSGLQSMHALTIDQLKWWLKNGDTKKPFSPTSIPLFDGASTMTPIQWNADAMPIGAEIHKVLYGMRTEDRDNLLLDAVSLADIYADPDVTAIAKPVLDALVVEVSRLTRKMDILQAAMGTAGAALTVKEYQISDPVKLRGTMQVAVLFMLSDGQTITVWFHNPDTTPAKLMPLDELVSWKWMLNKRDVTIVVAPERGRDLNVREVARRLMRLAERNSATFARANAKLAEKMAAEASLDDEITGLSARLERLNTLIEVARERKADAERASAAALADPTTAAGYAAIKGNEAALLANQDTLDAFFNTRIVEVRNALRELGWDGEAYMPLGKNGAKLEIHTKRVGGGGNVVGVTYYVTGSGGEGEAPKIVDDLTSSEVELAQDIDRHAPAAVPADPEPVAVPAREPWRVEADAFGDGMPGYIGTRDGDSAAGIITEPLGSWAFTRLGDAFQAIFPTGEGTYAGGDTAATPADAYASMVARGRWGMLQSEIAAAAREGDPADKLAPGTFVPPADTGATAVPAVPPSELPAAVDPELAPAVAELQIARATAANNEPINRAEGDIEQADIEGKTVAGIDKALAILAGQESGAEQSAAEPVKLKDEYGNVIYEVTVPDGSIRKIQRLNSAESMGLPGWHDVTDEAATNTWLADSKEDAIATLALRFPAAAAESASVDPAPTEGPSATEPTAPASAEPDDGRVTRTSDLLDGTTVKDGEGNLYRVHYQRNALVIAHPIVDGKAQVNADTTVRFWTDPSQPASGDNDRLDPIYVVETPDTAEPADVHLNYIRIAADSLAELRAVDVERVLGAVSADNIDGVTRESLGAWIAEGRPDLAGEVTDVLAELQIAAVPAEPERDPSDVAADPAGPLVVEPAQLPVAAEPSAVADPVPAGPAADAPAAPTAAEDEAADRAYLEGLTGGAIDLMAEDVIGRIEPMFAKYTKGEMFDLLNQAAKAYEQAVVGAAKSFLAAK